MILGADLEEIHNFQVLKTAGIPGVFCVFLRDLSDPECPVTTSEKARAGATSAQKKRRGNILPYAVSEIHTASRHIYVVQNRCWDAWENFSKKRPWEYFAILGCLSPKLWRTWAQPTRALVRHNFGLGHPKMACLSHGPCWRCFLTPLYIDFEQHRDVALPREFAYRIW